MNLITKPHLLLTVVYCVTLIIMMTPCVYNILSKLCDMPIYLFVPVGRTAYVDGEERVPAGKMAWKAACLLRFFFLFIYGSDVTVFALIDTRNFSCDSLCLLDATR